MSVYNSYKVMTSNSQLVSQEDYKKITFVCRMCETESTSTYIFTKPIVCVNCGKRIRNLENSIDGIIVHNKEHYVCKICIKFYSSVNSLRKHLKTIHGSPILHTCARCEKSFISKKTLQRHIETHKKEWYQCPKCPRRFTKVKLLRKHKKFHLKLRAHICNTCGQTFSSLSYLKVHSLLHLDYQNRKCQCKICFKYFSNKKCVQLHVKFTHSNDKPYKCACGKAYKRFKDVKYHIETCKRKDPHSECGKQFSSQSGLYGTVRSSLRSYECDTCKKTFKTKAYIRKHVIIHLREKPYQCHVCKKRFLRKYELNRHEKVHSSLRLHECDTCKKTFKTKIYIRNHVLIHLPREKHQCHVCKKRFLRKYELNRHEKVHSSMRPYECDTCKKTFKTKAYIKKHIIIHLPREKHYQCHVCNKRFLKRYHLNEHGTVHSSVRPYECDTCKKTFKRKTEIRKHVVTHLSRETPYLCSVRFSIYS